MKCSAVHFTDAARTIEGEVRFMDYFVVPKEADCSVLVVADHSENPWGGCSVTLQECPSLCAAYGFDRVNKCAPEVVLHEAKCCGDNAAFARPQECAPAKK